MRTIGFPISNKENEKRRAILPEHISRIKNKDFLFFESGYGESLNIKDEEYKNVGVNIVSRKQILKKDVICDPKIGDANYLQNLKEKQMIFGWIHAVQNEDITNKIIENKLTAIAWEDMFYYGQHVFWKNNELAGEAAIMHAFTLFGKIPRDCRVAVIGRGNVAMGAYKTLTSLGADVTVYSRKTEKLLKKKLGSYNVIVNAVLWDVNRSDHIIYEEDLFRLKKPGIIIDISCDESGAIETSVPTEIKDPIFYKNNVMHYVVDHTPALVSYSATKVIGDEICKYLDYLIEEKEEETDVLKDAIIIRKESIIDKRIIEFQKR